MGKNFRESIRKPATQQYVAGIDVGGTSIKSALFKVEDGSISKEQLFSVTEPTVRGVKPHVEQIAGIIEQLNAGVPEGGVLSAVGVASPGRFDGKGNLMPGTNPNM